MTEFCVYPLPRLVCSVKRALMSIIIVVVIVTVLRSGPALAAPQAASIAALTSAVVAVAGLRVPKEEPA